MTRSLLSIAFVASIVLPAVAAAQGQEHVGDPKRGGELVQERCASCHGLGPQQPAASTDTAGKAPSFAELAKRTDSNNLDLFQKMQDKRHPPIQGGQPDRQQMRDIVAYIRTATTGDKR